MKIDRTRLKKSTSEVPADCQALIEKLRICTHSELLEELQEIETWTFGKCELYHWIDILDICDTILEEAANRNGTNWALACDLPENSNDKDLLLWVLHFTTLLIEHSFSRHLYNSMEHLIALLSSNDMQVVLGVLNLLYMFSKRSNFITRLNNDKRQALVKRLTYLAESWGGKENGFGLAECCEDSPLMNFPPSATTLHYEFYTEANTDKQPKVSKSKTSMSLITSIHIDKVDKKNKTPDQLMDEILATYHVPVDKQMQLFTHLRLAYSFSDWNARLFCVQARLQALSVLVYSNALVENAHSLLYPGLLEELVELLELQQPNIMEIRAAALRTLTSIIHLDRNPHFPKKPGSRLNMIIDVTGAAFYHGLLPALVRTCINSLTTAKDPRNPFPLPLATALFSFLYHLASYEAGGEALVSCGMMESLLRVINWPGQDYEHITFVTRAVRVIDLITNLDMQAFHTHGGLNSFINRLELEVNVCKEDQPFEIPSIPLNELNGGFQSDEDRENSPEEPSSNSMDLSEASTSWEHSSTETVYNPFIKREQPMPIKNCLPQRAALLKSMLNFLKKAIQDAAFTDVIRHVMEGSLPSSLKHIISNAEYYGPSLFLLATDVVTVYVFHEPSHLSCLQENGLTFVVLHALLVKEVPATREVLGSLPNVFSALCLNSRGLASFVIFNPFERLFKVLLSPDYLAAMRRRRSSDPMGDTATNLGNAMDELMRHQPSLKGDATRAIIKLLEELVTLGKDPQYVCWRGQNKSDTSPTQTPRQTGANDSSDEEDEEEEEASTSSHPQREETPSESCPVNEKTPIALIDYILNVMKFIDAILSNNSTDDHCREFITLGGLMPLLSILSLPNLPVDYPALSAAQAVATVCKSILTLVREPRVLKEGLRQLNIQLEELEQLYKPERPSGNSVLLHELASAPNLETAFNTQSATPLLHAMSACHGYVVMFVQVCRTAHGDIRAIAMSTWGSEQGLEVLKNLALLYTSLVWETTLLLALCSDDLIPAGSQFGKEDLDKLVPPESKNQENSSSNAELGATSSGSDMEIDSVAEKKESCRITNSVQLKYIKSLLGASSRLGRALAELFGLLVKLSVGSSIRVRRNQQFPPYPTLPAHPAPAVATELGELLARGVLWNMLPETSITKFKLTFLICSVGFTTPILFDEKNYPYHLLLQKFVQLGGQTAFFSTYRWALSAGGTLDPSKGIDNPYLPDGTGKFLDSWLLLLEKLVNPKTVLDTPHSISMKHGVLYKTFDPYHYLKHIHKLAFDAVMLLWDKKPLKSYGSRMSESILTILRHILRGEKIIKERLSKEEYPPSENAASSSTSGPSSSSTSFSAQPTSSSWSPPSSANHGQSFGIYSENLKQLMDMGFTREHCMEALAYTPTMELATLYLLNNPHPSSRHLGSTSSKSTRIEDEHLLKAITLSLNDKAMLCSEQDCEKHFLTKETIDRFTENSLEACLRLLDYLPETVFRVTDLLMTITKRNGEEWRDTMLRTLINDIKEKVEHICLLFREQYDIQIIVQEMLDSTLAKQMSARLHLFTLIFEGPMFNELRMPCALAVQNAFILPLLVDLVVKSEEILRKTKSTPIWLSLVITLIDLQEKAAVCSLRKERMHKVTNRVWRWLDITTGKWNTYSSSNNKLINEAYWNGENFVRIHSGRRRYTIQFNAMAQNNDENGTSRPITLSLLVRENVEGKELADKKPDKREDKDKMETEEPAIPPEKERKRNRIIQGLCESAPGYLIRALVGFLKMPIDQITLQALLRLCLRLTRKYPIAVNFATLGGIEYMLSLTKECFFPGVIGLATLLIRHVLEDPQTLRFAMEKIIRMRSLTNIPPAYKEVMFLLRNTGHAITRDPDAFLEVAKSILRVDLNILSKRNAEEDTRLLIKTISKQTPPEKKLDEVSSLVINELLNYLIRVIPGEESAKSVGSCPSRERNIASTKSSSGTTIASTISTTLPPTSSASALLTPSGNLTLDASSSPTSYNSERVPLNLTVRNNAVTYYIPPRSLLVPARANVRNTSPSSESSQDSDDKSKNMDTKKNSEEWDDEWKRTLLAKSAILKILAEIIRSYPTCTKAIVEHTYYAGQSELITDDCTFLAFLLDKLLPLQENNFDRDCPAMTRMVISAIASCNFSPDSQTILVNEVKAALQRALQMPESTKKHSQIQVLSGLISAMIDNCPPTANNYPTLGAHLKIQHNLMNNIVKIMWKKGLLIDLARVPHYLDLSNPNTAASLNAAMKPLETLSRIINQPTTQSNKILKNKLSPNTNNSEPVGVPSGTSNSEANHAQGEEIVEDNTEQDISNAVDTIGPNSENARVLDESDFEAMDAREVTTNDIEVQTNDMETDDTEMVDESVHHHHHHSEQTQEQDDDDSDSSEDSESNPNSSPSIEGGNEDDDDDDEDDADDNEDDEDACTAYDEDGLEFFESDEGLPFRIPGFDRENEDILMIQYSDPDPNGPASLVPWNSNNFPLPFGIFEDPSNGNDTSGGITPSRSQQRINRQRRYQYLQINPRAPNPPVILQRILGPSAHELSEQVSNEIEASFADTRVIVLDSGLGILTNHEEEEINFVDQSGYIFGPSLAATLNNIPTALHWWVEEAKLLDGDSIPDCVTDVLDKLIPHLEKLKNEEISDRKEKRKRQQEEEDTKRRKDSEERPSNEAKKSNTNRGPSEITSPTENLAESMAESVLRIPSCSTSTPILRSNEANANFVPQSPGGTLINDWELFEISTLAPTPTIANTNASIVIDANNTRPSPGLSSIPHFRRNNQEDISNDPGPPPPLIPLEQALDMRNAPTNRNFAENNSGIDWSELLDLEAAATWLRSHMEIRNIRQTLAAAVDETHVNETNETSTNNTNTNTSSRNGSTTIQENSSTNNSTSELPEGVDPSFLSALPEELRAEVIADQLRLQRLRQRAEQQSVEAPPTSFSEVNPEFLAALPPNIQDEVLAQHRLERQRRAAATSNPNEPVDAAAFFQSMPPSLRQSILTDIEDSQIAALPPELAQEAQTLRREWEARNRQLMQERFFSHVSTSGNALSSILRNSSNAHSRPGTTTSTTQRYALNTQIPRTHWGTWEPRSGGQPSVASTIAQSGNLRLRGRQLLDHESLSCLLVILFIDDPKINTGRLHRVIRNFCYHHQTREWVIKTLLSIMERSNESRSEPPLVSAKPRRITTRSQTFGHVDGHSRNTTPSWLNISMDAALGCRASVFSVIRQTGKRGRGQQDNNITIHPQAAPTVFRHTLELLISLSKSFPGYFLPKKDAGKKENFTSMKLRGVSSCSSLSRIGARNETTDFWEMLLKLDTPSTSKKGKSVARTHSSSYASDSDCHSRNFETSAFAQLVKMLGSPVVKRSHMLTDKMLRLLSLISIGLPDVNYEKNTKQDRDESDESVPLAEQHLKAAIEVITSKTCSEEGLEDATALLMNLSNCPDPSRTLILRLLLNGAMALANMVNDHIGALLDELKEMHRNMPKSKDSDPIINEKHSKGIVTNRFTKGNVIVTAPTKTKAGCDLQLTSMVNLTSKTSSQAFFLRILKVIVQIRESVRIAHKKNQESQTNCNGNSEGDKAGEQSSISMVTNGESTSKPVSKKNIKESTESPELVLPTLSEQLPLDHLWSTLSACLLELAETPDHHAVLVLQPAVEAFFLVHASAAEEHRIASDGRESRSNNDQANRREEPPPEVAMIQPDVIPINPPENEGSSNQQRLVYLQFNWETQPAPAALTPDQHKFLKFAETHRTVLNQILRQSSNHLADGPFAVLVDHTRVLDFDVKRRYFRTELEQLDEGIRREELAVTVRRSNVFEDSFRELHRRTSDEWKNRFYIVFEGEEGQDAGGLLREWYVIISREIFNPMYALFTTSPGDRVTYMINSSSHCNPNHLCYFKFVGRVIAKAIYDNKLLECYFTRSFYKHILGILVKYTDMESEDYTFYQGLVYLMEHHVSDLGYDLTFSAEVQEFGVTDVRDLIPNGRNIQVCEQNKMDYIRLVCQMKMAGAIRQQINAFLEGFYDIIPKRLISIFNEQELELLISGLPNVDIEDLKANTEYHKYQPSSLQIQWFWRALRSFNQAERAKFLQFVTGTSKVPLQGFGALEGMNGVQKFQIHRDDRSTDRLPSAHTCFNQLDLPVYETYDKLRTNLLKAIHECSEGFGFA